MDANSQPLCTLITKDEGTIAGADVDSTGQNGRFVSTGEKESLIDILVTEEVYNSLLSAKKLHIDADLSTSTPSYSNPSNKDRVTVTADDKLTLQLYMLAHPSYELNINLDDDDDDNSNKKGGVR